MSLSRQRVRAVTSFKAPGPGDTRKSAHGGRGKVDRFGRKPASKRKRQGERDDFRALAPGAPKEVYEYALETLSEDLQALRRQLKAEEARLFYQGANEIKCSRKIAELRKLLDDAAKKGDRREYHRCESEICDEEQRIRSALSSRLPEIESEITDIELEIDRVCQCLRK